MTKEEIIKIFEENNIAEGTAAHFIINATKLAEIFTKHEADILKEFVEWFKNNYYFAKYPLFAKNSEELIEKFLEEKNNGK